MNLLGRARKHIKRRDILNVLAETSLGDKELRVQGKLLYESRWLWVFGHVLQVEWKGWRQLEARMIQSISIKNRVQRA
jgi:hypothetical protein